MRKQLLFFAALIVCSLIFFPTKVFATKVYSLNENFITAPSETNWGFSTVTGHTFTYDATSKVEQVRWTSATSYSTKTLSTAVAPGTDNLITIEMIVKYYTAGYSTSNSGALYFLDSNGNAIFGLGFYRSSSTWKIGRATTYEGATNPTVIPTITDYLGVDQPTAKITVVLDFNAHTLSYTAVSGSYDYSTRTFTPSTTSVSSTAQSFINTSASNFKTFLSNYYRTHSTTGTVGYDLISVNISSEQAVSTSTVTVNYLDQNGAVVKTAASYPGQAVTSIFSVADTAKISYTNNGYYYAYDKTATASGATYGGTGDTVKVQSSGATINLRFKKFTLTPATYTWTGVNSANCNETELNFTTDASNSLGYQSSNDLVFDSNGSNKAVSLTSVLNLGSKNISIASDGYTLTSSNGGSFIGTGTFNVNVGTGSTTNLNLINNLTGGLNLQSGIAVILNDACATKYTLASGTKLILQSGATFSKAIAGSGTITIEAASNNFNTSTITGASTINLILDNAGSGTSSTWSDYFGGSFPSGAQVNVTSTVSSAGFGVYDGLLTSNKVNLGDNVRLLRWYNQSTSSGGTSTITVGELNGSSSSTIEGGMVESTTRILAYEIGSLNTDATFNGVIKNFGTITTTPLYIYKKGTGTWTLTGTNTYSPGLFNVDAGKVVISGSLSGTAVPVTVASGATLSGNGSIAGATTVNGILEGRLNFGSSLTLAGTANLTVNGFATTQFDSVTVAGALTNGGTLNIAVNAAAPAVNTSIRLIKAGTYTGSFTTVNLPSNYTFNAATGILTYTLGTKTANISSNNVNVYPTLSDNDVHVNAENISSIEVVNLMGQSVKQIKTTANNNTINLTDLSNGAYFVKVQFTDGSVKAQRILFQK